MAREFGAYWFDENNQGAEQRQSAEQERAWQMAPSRAMAQSYGRGALNALEGQAGVYRRPVQAEQSEQRSERMEAPARERRIERRGRSLAERRKDLKGNLWGGAQKVIATVLVMAAIGAPTMSGENSNATPAQAAENLEPPKKTEERGEMPSAGEFVVEDEELPSVGEFVVEDDEEWLPEAEELERATGTVETPAPVATPVSVAETPVPAATVAPATETTAPAGEQEEQVKHGEFTVAGEIQLKGIEGKVEVPNYHGGYVLEDDAYRKEFDDKYVETAFSVSLEGATDAETVQNWLKSLAVSPKAFAAAVSHMNYERPLGIDEFRSMDEEEAFADKMAAMPADQYDALVNQFYTMFSKNVREVRFSEKCYFARDMMDEVGAPNEGDESEIEMYGYFRGNDGQRQMTFYGTMRDGSYGNIVSDSQARQNELRSARNGNYADRERVSTVAWVNMARGNWEYKMGAMPETTKPTEAPEVTPGPTEKPPVVTPEPTEKPPVVTPEPTEEPTPAPTPEATLKPKDGDNQERIVEGIENQNPGGGHMTNGEETRVTDGQITGEPERTGAGQHETVDQSGATVTTTEAPTSVQLTQDQERGVVDDLMASILGGGK